MISLSIGTKDPSENQEKLSLSAWSTEDDVLLRANRISSVQPYENLG